MAAADLAATLRRRFPQIDATLETDLAACEEAVLSESIAPKEALKQIQKLYAHQEKIAAAKPGAQFAVPKDIHPSKQERAS